MTTRISHGASGAVRRLAGWVGGGSVVYPLFDLPPGEPSIGGDEGTLY